MSIYLGASIAQVNENLLKVGKVSRNLGKKIAIAPLSNRDELMFLRFGCLLGLLLILFCPNQMHADPHQTPHVSIIVPVYNMEPYLPRAMESMLRQTYENIEIICVDDGSTDNSFNILKKYALRDLRVVILHNDINRGTAYARIRGVLAAKGKFIMFLDPDDELTPDIVEIAQSTAENTGSDVVHFDTEWVYPTGKTRRQPWWQRPVTYTRTSKQMNKAFADRRLVYLWDKLYARDAVVRAAEYLLPFVERNNIICSTDKLFSCFIIANTKKCIGIKNVGYRYYKCIGVCARGRQNLLCALRRTANIRDANLQMAIGMIDLGNSAHAAQLQVYFQSCLLEHIATLPLKDGIDLFAKYTGGIPLKLQLKIASDMRRTSPGWYRAVQRVAKFSQLPH
ncbi:MAG: glycosyltransferase family 2 protein [Puniceicoccales bacterium]|nr:glycosyltransferase family 2 protein [Puniceicoccales bacterium]